MEVSQKVGFRLALEKRTTAVHAEPLGKGVGVSSLNSGVAFKHMVDY